MLILNVQFWPGDRDQAMQLVRLMADLESKKRDDVILLFTARFDADFDEEAIDYASAKFQCYRFKGTRTATGWPNGPNQVMGESYSFCVEGLRDGRIPRECDGVMFIESDCVPLARDWLDQILTEWKEARRLGRKVLGAHLKYGDANIEHINGNCIISLDFWRACKDIFNPQSRGGWDATLRSPMIAHGYPSKLIWSDYRLGTDDNPWKGCDYLWQPKKYGARENPHYGIELRPVWYHGIKTMAGINCVREKLLNE